jgi:hypothetical protein
MADYTQSATQTLLAHQEIARGANAVGTAIDCSSWLLAQITAWLANVGTTANATGVAVAIQGSIEASGNDWIDLVRFTGTTTAAVGPALANAEAIGDTVIEIAATTGFTVGNLVYLRDATGVAESEWGEIAAVVTNTSITLVDGLIVAKEATNDLVYSQAERFAVLVECAGLKRLRAVVLHQAATGSSIRSKVTAVAATDIE